MPCRGGAGGVVRAALPRERTAFTLPAVNSTDGSSSSGEASSVGAAHPPRRWPRRLAAATVGIVAALVIAEIGLRVAGFSYRLYPESIEFGMPDPTSLATDFDADRDVFWVPHGYQESMLTVLRHTRPSLVLMGCSCTEWGQHDRLLAGLVRERLPGRELSAMNLGVAGWTTFQGLTQLRRDIVPAAPRVVTIYYGWNDHWIGFGIEDKQVNRVNDSLLFRMQQHVRIAQLVTKAIVTWWHGQREGPILRVQPEDFEGNLRAMVRECRAHNITPILLTAPTSHQPGQEPAHLARRHLKNLADLVPLHQKYVNIVRRVASEENVILCDLAARFAGLPAGELRQTYFEADGIHLRPPGNRLIAETLYDTLANNGLLEVVLK
jgi:lysophospholipase L1-like esterase